jgi:polysaccharide biosynthesis/export protein
LFRYRLFIGPLLVAMLSTSGCLHHNPAVTRDEMDAFAVSQPEAFSVGDVLEFKFFYHPELNEVQTIRRDGNVHLQLVGEVEAAGHSNEDLRNVLLERFSGVLKNADIAIIARSKPVERVYVSGEVVAPGPIDMQGRITALQAIMYAGGFKTDSAATDSVVLIRHHDGKRFGTLIDLAGALRGEESKPMDLRPEDIVYVPTSQILHLNTWLDQHFYDLLPDMSMSYTYTDSFNHGKINNVQR